MQNTNTTSADAVPASNKMQNTASRRYQQESLPISSEPLDVAVKLVRQLDANSYVLYERDGEWSLGVGRALEITLDTNGTLRRSDGKFWQAAAPGEAIAKALTDVPFDEWRLYGTADFEFACLTYRVENTLNPGPLLKLTIPFSEVRIRKGTVLLRSLDDQEMSRLKAMLRAADDTLPLQSSVPVHLDVRATGCEQYQRMVASAVEEMQARRYQKVILSRAVDVPVAVDMITSYGVGRKFNTPARSFLLKDGEFQAYGFSPEVVVTVDANGSATTQPLAGTRALTGNQEVNRHLRQELETDVKEIAEHAVSVKLAVAEMSAACQRKSVVVEDFMNVLERGSVQHLASHVKGVLAENATAWVVFEKLFPAVTASGIPKKEALESIIRHEGRMRGLYSGCVLIADSDGALDAALVLRSVYRDGEHCWLQAGAGLVPHSTPERECEETSEKLASVAPYLYAQGT